MFKRRLNSKGETLAETIIALSILAIGITVASTTILNSIRNLTNAKDRVIAINIAREGIEAVRNIRDTNWLFYSDKRRQCWNNMPGSDGCDGNTPVLPGTYIIYKHSDQSWHLQPADENPGIDSNGDGIPNNDLDLINLSLVDIDKTFDSDQDGNPANDLDFYNHKNANVNSPMGTEIRQTPFSRYVVIEYLENNPDPLSAPSNISPPNDSINTLNEWNDGKTDKDALNRIRVTSVVGWKTSGTAHTAELKTILTDHLGRENLEN